MTVYCLLKIKDGITTLEYVFEKHSRAFATRERILEKDKECKIIIEEMYVYAGEENKNDSSKKA